MQINQIKRITREVPRVPHRSGNFLKAILFVELHRVRHRIESLQVTLLEADLSGYFKATC